MKKKLKRLSACLTIVLIISLLTGCDTPPDIHQVEAMLQDNRDAFQTITTYLVNPAYADAIITDADGTMFSNFADIKIDDNVVNSAITHLFDEVDCVMISKMRNTIEYTLWIGVSDISCGLAYEITNSAPPEIQFVTELVSLSDEGWYYYVADYNEWRITNGTE